MFTLEQIQTAHSKVKSGADFPSYIAAIKTFGILSYDHFVTDGHTNYYGNNGFILTAPPKWDAMVIRSSSAEHLKKDLKIHQQGQTDYIRFCKDSAAAGVEKWTVDLIALTCTYYDLDGKEMLSENIPQ